MNCTLFSEWRTLFALIFIYVFIRERIQFIQYTENSKQPPKSSFNVIWGDTVCLMLLPILEYCSPVWGSAANSHLQLRERQVRAVARRCPDPSLIPLNHRHCVAGLCMLYKFYSDTNHCLHADELSPDYLRERKTRAAVSARPYMSLRFRWIPCRNRSRFARCFLSSQARTREIIFLVLYECDSGVL